MLPPPTRLAALRGRTLTANVLCGASRTDVSAVASFVGCVRGHSKEDDVFALALEDDPGMTERAIEAMIVEAEARFAGRAPS